MNYTDDSIVTTESTPIFDALDREYAMERAANLFEEAAEKIWPLDKPFVTTHVPDKDEWEDLMKYLSANLMVTMSDPEFLVVLFPEGKVGPDAIREGELRSIGYRLALKALEMVDYPEWEDVEV